MPAPSVFDPATDGLGLDAIPLERLETQITTLTGQISGSADDWARPASNN